MPKLIVLGTNDRYWPVDAVKLYYGNLEGEKYIHYVPNKGMGLGREPSRPCPPFTMRSLPSSPCRGSPGASSEARGRRGWR